MTRIGFKVPRSFLQAAIHALKVESARPRWGDGFGEVVTGFRSGARKFRIGYLDL